MNKNLYLLMILLFSTLYLLKSQTPGSLDLNFGNQGIAESTSEKNYYPYYLSIQENSGEIFVGGQENKINTNGTEGFVKRFDFYGNPKSAFGQNGKLKIIFPGAINQRIFQIIPDKSNLGTQGFFLRGYYTDVNSNNIYYVSKHNADGGLDLTYGNNGILKLYGHITGDYIYSLDLNTSTGHQFLKRYYLIDGTIDNSFANADLPNLDSIQHFDTGQLIFFNAQNNGKIVLLGYNKISDTEKNTAIARFNPDGTLDNTFGSGGFITFFDFDLPQESVTQSDNKIIYTDGNGIFKRLNENGTVDSTYGTDGILNINTGPDLYLFSYNLKIHNDDKIYFNGEVLNNYFNSGETESQYIARLKTDGTVDFVYKSFENSIYSEIWSTALINNSFILTNGVYITDNDNWRSVIQRVYTKTPIISLFGSSTNNTDFDLTTNDYKIFSGNVTLSQGAIKFRLDHSNSYNWGGLNLSGISTMGENDIQIQNTGDYEVIFNLQNGEYSFTNLLSTKDSRKTSITIYPNPTQDFVYFSAYVSNTKIFDNSGKLLFTNSKKINKIDMSAYPPNIYIINITNEDGSTYGKEIIKK